MQIQISEIKMISYSTFKRLPLIAFRKETGAVVR